MKFGKFSILIFVAVMALQSIALAQMSKAQPSAERLFAIADTMNDHLLRGDAQLTDTDRKAMANAAMAFVAGEYDASVESFGIVGTGVTGDLERSKAILLSCDARKTLAGGGVSPRLENLFREIHEYAREHSQDYPNLEVWDLNARVTEGLTTLTNPAGALCVR